MEQQSSAVTKPTFEVKGYFLEIFIDNKFYGAISSEYIPERKMGYAGREKTILGYDITTSTKKRLKKGTEVITYYFPVCGRSLQKC